MPLIDKTKERISDQLLTELTNQGDPNASAVDDVRLQVACDDVESEFLVETGLAYDDLDQLHNSAASQGVVVKLMEWTGITGRNTEQLLTRYRAMLIRIAATRGSERRLLPSTTSTLDPSQQRQGARPDADRRVYDDYTLDRPRESGNAEGRRYGV